MHCLLLSGGEPPASAGGLTVRFDLWDAGPGELSLPRLMAQRLLRLRREHAAWAYETGARAPEGGRPLAEALKGGSPLSMWWCSTLYERHPKVTPRLHELYLLRALEQLMLERGASSLEARGLDAPCLQALRGLCAARGWAFSAPEPPRKEEKGRLRRAYDATPAPLRALARLVHWLWSVKRLLPRAELPKSKDLTGTVATYFPNVAPELAERGVFRSRYWESLHDALAEEAPEGGRPPVRWLFVRFPSPQGSLRRCLAWRDGFAKRGRDGVSFHYLEEFLGPGDLAQALWRYARVALSSLLRQREARRRFRLPGSLLDLWPLLGADYAESFRGWRCLERCLQQRGMENYVKAAGPQRWLTFPMENCPWERMLCSAAHRMKAGPCLGAQHSTIRPTDFRYFDDPRTWTDPETRDFQPDLVAGNGESACSQWRAAGVPQGRLGQIEALRYLYLSKLREEGRGRPWSSRLLVVTSFFADETEAHLRLLAGCLKAGVLDAASVTVKPHPYLPVERSLERLLGPEAKTLRISTAPMPRELEDRPMVWASNSTTAVLEAALMGLPVLVMQPSGDFDLCPLQDLPGLARTGSVEEVAEALRSPAPLDLPEDYLRLDEGLPRWRTLLGLGRKA